LSPAGFSLDIASETFRTSRTSSSISRIQCFEDVAANLLPRRVSQAGHRLAFRGYDRFAHPTVHGAPLAAHQIGAFDGLLQATAPGGFEIAAKTVPMSEVEQAWPNGGFLWYSTKAAASCDSGQRHLVLRALCSHTAFTRVSIAPDIVKQRQIRSQNDMTDRT
jgi:hypothetical protein